MKLVTARVTNYKCIKNSDVIKIEPTVTCLVGKNESGKTAVLQALERINPLDGDAADYDLLEYPRAEMSEYKERHESDPAKVLHLEWELEPDDREAIDALLGSGVVSADKFQMSKGYANKRNWIISVDEKTAIRNLVEAADLYDQERTRLLETETLKELRENLAARAKVKEGEGSASPRESALITDINSRFGAKTESFWWVVVNLLKERMPKMVYFSEYLRMPGQVSLNDLKVRLADDGKGPTPGQKVFLALISMAGKSPEDLEDIGQFEPLQGELEGVQLRLTKEIFRFWRQNRALRVIFRFDLALEGDDPPFNEGYVMRTRIENLRHGVTTSFDERSSGFVWFFSFLVWFNSAKRQYGDKLLILLDEPGLGLHASAQADLLRYIDERLADKFQVIYTTHSPFMIDPANLLRSRTVEDIFVPATENPPAEAIDHGTKVGSDVLSTDRDTLFPLQAALGYEITQTLFIGKHSLLVEGPSELLYIPWFSRKLASLDREGLRKEWVIVPCGGIDKIPAFLSLFAGQRLHIATILDYASGQKAKVKRLREGLLKTGHVLTLDTFAGQSEADIEDMLGRDAYTNLVNDCYELKGAERLPKAKPKSAPSRVVKEVESHFDTVAISGDEFNHFRPSEFLTHGGIDYQLSDEQAALARFEALFHEINLLIGENEAEAPSTT